MSAASNVEIVFRIRGSSSRNEISMRTHSGLVRVSKETEEMTPIQRAAAIIDTSFRQFWALAKRVGNDLSEESVRIEVAGQEFSYQPKQRITEDADRDLLQGPHSLLLKTLAKAAFEKPDFDAEMAGYAALAARRRDRGR